MKIKLSLFLLCAFLAVAMISILTISIFINISLKDQFTVFAIERQDAKKQEIIDKISLQWQDGECWDPVKLGQIGTTALDEGFILRVFDEAGTPIWDTSQQDDSACMMKKEEICSEMAPYLDSTVDNSDSFTSSLSVNGDTIGKVELVSFTPFYFEKDDLNFISAVNRQILIAAVLSVAVAILLAVVFSRLISLPIVITGKFARTIATGKYTNLDCPRFVPAEIHSLVNSINHVSRSLEAQEKLRRQLSADVAHELRTPLASLQSHLEAMIDGVWPADEAHLTSCHQEVIRLTRLVSGLETLAEYETDQMRLNKERISMKNLISETLKMMRPSADEKGVRLILQIEDIILEIDEDKIKQVFINLISNSLKYTPEGGEVTISSSLADKEFYITIEDTGIGIPPEDLPFIFERFYRVDKSRNRINGGSGIGLTIVKEIIEAHNGSVDVESIPGISTKFIISLPI